jgi:predicted metal-dependent hydrolase
MRRINSILTILETRQIKLEGCVVSYVLKSSAVARYTRLEVRPGSGLCVIIPDASSAEAAERLIKDKRRWVLAKLKQFDNSRYEPPITEYSVMYLGRKLPLITEVNDVEKPWVRLESDRLIVHRRSEDAVRDLVETWMKKQSVRLFQQLIETHSLRMGVKCKKVGLNSAKTRWGSCSKNTQIRLNWKLVMAKPEAIEYVVIHELCHIQELNHSAAFWHLVDTYCPDWRMLRKWLKTNESVLSA